MRQFLWEYETPITLDELREAWRNDEDDERTFREYVDACMYWNNGALVEILTADTPKECRDRAVADCVVWYSDDDDDRCEMWLNGREIAERRSDGCRVVVRGVE